MLGQDPDCVCDVVRIWHPRGGLALQRHHQPRRWIWSHYGPAKPKPPTPHPHSAQSLYVSAPAPTTGEELPQASLLAMKEPEDWTEADGRGGEG